MSDLAVFSSWHGRWSDSPKAIAEELVRREAPLELAAIVADDATPPPAPVRAIRPGGDAEREALEEARWIVSNDVLPLAFEKRPDATYLQTWHGTPLKRIGFDVTNPRFPDAEYHYAVELVRDVARWDLLLSPNSFSTPLLRGAFRFEGPILESGYPRNDVLRSDRAAAVRDRVRAELRLPDGALAVLYAPTWRDSFEHSLELDLDLLRERLGESVVVLVRAHGLTAASDRLQDAATVRNVTRWPETAELYLAADVLVTDYSSAMVDFAITGKPMLFYTYDLDEYRDRLRGFYVDFEREVPGPLLRTSAEVADALGDLPGVTAASAERYDSFRARLCHLDDGRAAERVTEATFAGCGQ